MPKSLIDRGPVRRDEDVPGFTSRCTMRSLRAAASAEPTCAPMLAVSDGVSVPCSLSSTDRGVDSMSCMTMQGRPSYSTTSKTVDVRADDAGPR